MSAIEEPIYMPGMARPTSPEASYQVGPNFLVIEQAPFVFSLGELKSQGA